MLLHRFNPPKAHSIDHLLTGASRLDVAIKCSSGGSITVTHGWGGYSKKKGNHSHWIPMAKSHNGGSYGEWSGSSQWEGSTWSGAATIATLTIQGSETSDETPFIGTSSQWSSVRPAYAQVFPLFLVS